MKTITMDDLVAAATERFGGDPLGWAFVCPRCGDVATGADFVTAGAEPGRAGQECIGRTVDGRGCDWTAYGLFRGPVEVAMPDGTAMGVFELAPTAGLF